VVPDLLAGLYLASEFDGTVIDGEVAE
jgi:hypothetical protein